MSKEPEFAVFPLDWVRHPKCRKLRQADPANPDRWWVLMTLATTCRAGGRLVASDGTPLTAEDFAWDHDRQEEAWAAFLDLAKKLKLLGVDDHGALYVTTWYSWNRDAAKAKALEEDKYRKRAERAEAKSEALELELERLRGDLSESVQDCPNSVRPVQLEEKRVDLIRSEETQIDRLEGKICLSSFSDKDLLEVAQSIHQRLKGKALPGPDKTALRKTSKSSAWSEYSLGDQAGALLIAEDFTRQRLDAGKMDPNGNTWFYVVTVAEAQLETAADKNSTNRAAIKNGWDLTPMVWDGDE